MKKQHVADFCHKIVGYSLCAAEFGIFILFLVFPLLLIFALCPDKHQGETLVRFLALPIAFFILGCGWLMGVSYIMRMFFDEEGKYVTID